MNNKFVEIEIQVQIENVKDLLKFLKKNAKFVVKERQIDRYYTPAHRNFIAKKPIKEWLRLRDSSGKFSINYKNWYYDKDGKSDYCDEFETEIKDIESIEKILSALNMKLIATVDKKRETWKYKDYELAMDNVKGLGDFVEIEFKGENTRKKPKEITRQMIDFLKKNNCGKVIRNYVGYPYQFLFPHEIKLEEF